MTEEKRLLEEALASMNKDTGEEEGDNMSSDFSNIFQSIDADRSEVKNGESSSEAIEFR